MKLPLSDMQGKKLGECELADELLVFDKGQQVLHEAVVALRAGQRRGTASTLTKGEVHGSGKKPWKQKGLGRARAGYRQSPVWRGGSVVFGPRPRDFSKKLSRKAARLAFRRAFSEKVAAGAVEVLDRLVVEEPKTRHFTAVLDSLKVTGTALVVVDDIAENLMLSSRNVPGIEVVDAHHVNTYQILRYARVLVTQDALAIIQERLGRKAAGKAA